MIVWEVQSYTTYNENNVMQNVPLQEPWIFEGVDGPNQFENKMFDWIKFVAFNKPVEIDTIHIMSDGQTWAIEFDVSDEKTGRLLVTFLAKRKVV